MFPARRGLFSIVFTELIGREEKRPLPWVETDCVEHSPRLPSDRTDNPSYYAGSLNDSEVTVNECARNSGLKSRSTNNTEGMCFVSVIHDNGRWSISTQSRGLSHISSTNTMEKRPLLAGNNKCSVSCFFVCLLSQ